MSGDLVRECLMVDFNMLDERGRVPVIADSDREGLPDVGTTVTLCDHDGDRCLGRVIKATEALLLVEPDFASWQSGPSGTRTAATASG